MNVDAAKNVAAQIIRDCSHLQRSYKQTSSAVGGLYTAGARRNWISKICLDYLFGTLGTEEREIVRLILDRVWRARPTDGTNRFDHVAKFPAVVELLNNLNEFISTPKEPTVNETTKSPATTITTITVDNVTMINGEPASNYSDAQLYRMIAKEEAAIEELSRIKNKPKRLEAEIARRQAGIEKLVTYLDSQG